MFDQILKALGGGNLGDIEAKAGDLLTRLEKLGADVIGSNGNLLQMVVSVAEDLGTLKTALADVEQIVADLKALHSSMSGVATGGTGASATPAAPVASPAPGVSVTSILTAAETIAAHAAPAIAAIAHSDPFQAKPLTRVAQVTEPRGGA